MIYPLTSYTNLVILILNNHQSIVYLNYLKYYLSLLFLNLFKNINILKITLLIIYPNIPHAIIITIIANSYSYSFMAFISP